jgi:hypothetical protein
LATTLAATQAHAGLLPLFLYGVDGDDETMVRLDVHANPPVIQLLGTVVNGSNPIQEMEALTWDPSLERLFVVSNAGNGPMFLIDPDDITGPPPANIPTTFVGNTGTIQMEGIALEPAANILYGVDNTTDPSRLVRVNKNNGSVTVVGPLEDASGGNFDNMEALAFTFTAPHVLYGADNPGEGPSQLVTINRLTGLVTRIGSGIGFVNVECLTFSPDGTLYGFSNGNSLQDRFITIDPTTGVGTLFKAVNAQGYDIEGCAFLESDIQIGVEPSSWSNVKGLYRTP